MALQTSIAQYFNSRKRRAVDDLNKVSNTNKVLILDSDSNKNISDAPETRGATIFDEEQQSKKKILFNESPKIVTASGIVPKLQRKTPKTTSASKNHLAKRNNRSAAKKSLLNSFEASIKEESSKQECEVKPVNQEKCNVPFEIKGLLSPRKQSTKVTASPQKSTNVSNLTPQKANTSKDDFKELRAKLLSSSRLDLIKSKINKGIEFHEELKESKSKIPPKSPSLKKFNKIQFELLSPTKKSVDTPTKRLPESPSLLKRSLLMSPGKSDNTRNRYISPRKLFAETSPVKSTPAYIGSSALSSSCPGLILPYKYRLLTETFSSIDAVISLLFNRKEIIYFSKLKSSVQQMSKRNLTETHLGQIHSVCPDLFSFRQEKLKHVPGQGDKYELVVIPVFQSNSDENINSNENTENSSLLTPSVLLERKKKLFSALLEKAKDYHQEFISTLNPPVILNREKLTRWHPEFDLDNVPDITPAPLPQPPNVEKYSSAKDVLSKARDMFICNPRMERALEKVSNASKESSSSTTTLSSTLKGIPKSLLERVRAKQAAKMAEVLTRNPEEVKQRAEYSRLPEIARIVNNTFVGEKKNVLRKALVLAKLNNSFREILSPSSMEHHLSLLIKCSSGWLSVVDYKKETFYKIIKDMHLSKVLESIQNAIDKL